jgi:frataxin
VQQGVLTVALGDKFGTYVLNKQSVNQEIWWSSPRSGPMRFCWSDERRTWVQSRDKNVPMMELLRREVREMLRVDVDLEGEAEGVGGGGGAKRAA